MGGREDGNNSETEGLPRARQIYSLALLVISLAIPIIRPIGLPIPIDPMTQTFYQIIENLPKGGKVWVGAETAGSNIAEMGPGELAIITRLMQLDVKILFVTTSSPDCIGVLNDYLNTVKARGVLKTYGENWVELPFIPGGETGISSLLANIRATTSSDYLGTSLDNLQAMNGMNKITDFNLIVHFGPQTTVEAYIRQMAKYGYTNPSFITLCITMAVSYIMPYYPGQVAAILKGSSGGAQYEKLVGWPGAGLMALDATSLSVIWVTAAIVVPNVYFIGRKFMKSGTRGVK